MGRNIYDFHLYWQYVFDANRCHCVRSILSTSVVSLWQIFLCWVPGFESLWLSIGAFLLLVGLSRRTVHHFADDIFKRIFLKEVLEWASFVLSEISLKLVPRGSINNNSALGQIMALHQTGDKSSYEPKVATGTDAYVALGVNELKLHISYSV